jgi:hypothetical protein
MHELAHIILGHTSLCRASSPMPAISSRAPTIRIMRAKPHGSAARFYYRDPRLLWMRRRLMPDDEVATHFGVSPDLLRWRVRMTGIDYQLGLSGPKRRCVRIKLSTRPKELPLHSVQSKNDNPSLRASIKTTEIQKRRAATKQPPASSTIQPSSDAGFTSGGGV